MWVTGWIGLWGHTVQGANALEQDHHTRIKESPWRPSIAQMLHASRRLGASLEHPGFYLPSPFSFSSVPNHFLRASICQVLCQVQGSSEVDRRSAEDRKAEPMDHEDRDRAHRAKRVPPVDRDVIPRFMCAVRMENRIRSEHPAHQRQVWEEIMGVHRIKSQERRQLHMESRGSREATEQSFLYKNNAA